MARMDTSNSGGVCNTAPSQTPLQKQRSLNIADGIALRQQLQEVRNLQQFGSVTQRQFGTNTQQQQYGAVNTQQQQQFGAVNTQQFTGSNVQPQFVSGNIQQQYGGSSLQPFASGSTPQQPFTNTNTQQTFGSTQQPFGGRGASADTQLFSSTKPQTSSRNRNRKCPVRTQSRTSRRPRQLRAVHSTSVRNLEVSLSRRRKR